MLVAERDLRWAVLASVLLERAVQLQMIASSLGPLHPIPQRAAGGDPRASSTRRTSPAEYWDAWLRELRRSGRAFDMPASSQ